jgi:hypothetical protein
MGAAKKAVREWTNREYRKCWDFLHGLKHVMAFIQGPSANKTWKLLELN